MFNTDYLSYQLSATRALVKFIRDHKSGVEINLSKCLEALEKGDVQSAVKKKKKIKLAGMGSMTDWFPPVVFPHEDSEYVCSELQALVYNWARLMALSFESD